MSEAENEAIKEGNRMAMMVVVLLTVGIFLSLMIGC